ncbi:hypothetical protein V7183_19715, partial [Bacillus sp. JJ1127]
QGKAKIAKYTPFTIQLLYATGETVQPVTIGSSYKSVSLCLTEIPPHLAAGFLPVTRLKMGMNFGNTLKQKIRLISYCNISTIVFWKTKLNKNFILFYFLVHEKRFCRLQQNLS